MGFHRPEAPLVDEWAFVPATDIFLVVGEARPPPLGVTDGVEWSFETLPLWNADILEH